VYHVLNRAVGRRTLFKKDEDYAAFERVLEEAPGFRPMRVLAYCLMPNHWHLVLWPRADGDLSAYVRWVTVTHTQRYHAHYKTAGTGPLYQGRFKSFPVQAGGHFTTVCRYVERNALRAGLVKAAERWRWSSLYHGVHGRPAWLADWPDGGRPGLAAWLQSVNRPETEGELAALRQSLARGAPYGEEAWAKRTAGRLGLESALRPRGRPRKTPAEREKRLPAPFAR
jgi:putative transposase